MKKLESNVGLIKKIKRLQQSVVEANPWKKKRKYGLLHLLCIKGRGAEILITAPLPFHHFHPKAVNLPHTDNRGTPNIPSKKLLKNPQSKRQSGSEEYEDPLK